MNSIGDKGTETRIVFMQIIDGVSQCQPTLKVPNLIFYLLFVWCGLTEKDTGVFLRLIHQFNQNVSARALNR